MIVERIAHLLGGKPKPSGGFMACCPAHDDRHPSLSIDEGHNGQPIFKCWAGCSQKEIIDALKARGLWKNGTSGKITEEERKERQAAKERTEQRKAEKQAKAAALAVKVWKQSKRELENPYRLRKKVPSTDTLKEINLSKLRDIIGYTPQANDAFLADGRILIVPIVIGGQLANVEMIDQNGLKTTLAGGKKAGGYWASEKLPERDSHAATIFIGEGVATALSGKAAREAPSVASLSSNNLPEVARQMRKRYPKGELIILADLLKKTGEPDPHAIEAAREIGGKLAIPDFGRDRPELLKDFNDLLLHRGIDAVKDSISVAKTIIAAELPKPPRTGKTVNLVWGCDLTPEPIDWIWNGWLASGKTHILGGQPGTGKTTIAMNLAATVTIGGRWPDGSKAPMGNVVIWSGEDDPKDTLIPRLALSGADLSKVCFISGIQNGDDRRSFDPAKDVEMLRATLDEVGNVKLLIVDPIVSAITGDSHKNSDVRRSLQPLVDLAVSINCALIGITHFSKGTGGRDPVERLNGSLAFGALARVVMIAAKHQKEGEDGKTVRLFIRAKSNIGPDDGGFEYDLIQDEMKSHPGIFSSHVLWGQPLEGSARELLAIAEATTEEAGSGKGTIEKWLIQILEEEGGAADLGTVMKAAKEMGFPERSVYRARKKLEVISETKGFGSNRKSEWKSPLLPKNSSLLPIRPTNLNDSYGSYDNAEVF